MGVSDITKVKYCVSFQVGGQEFLSSLSNPQIPLSSSGIAPGTLERWFVSRAPHWVGVFPSRIEHPGFFQPQCEASVGHQEMVIDYLRNSPSFHIQDSPKSLLKWEPEASINSYLSLQTGKITAPKTRGLLALDCYEGIYKNI